MNNKTILNDAGKIVGWVSRDGCNHPACRKARKEGRPFHAIPAGFAVKLSDYHFATEAEATAAVVDAAKKEVS